MPDYTPQTWGTGDTFEASDATEMSQQIDEEEERNDTQQIDIDAVEAEVDALQIIGAFQEDISVAVGAFVCTPTAATDTYTGTHRVPYIKIGNGPITSLDYHNQQAAPTGDTTPTGDQVIDGVSIEYPAATFYQLACRDAIGATIKPNGWATFGGVSVDVPDGATFWIRTHTTGAFRANRSTGVAGGGGRSTSDLLVSGTIADNTSFTYLVGPAVIRGTNTSAHKATVASFGDSHVNGNGDGINSSSQAGINTVTDRLGGGGFVVRASRSAGFSLINIGVGGDLELTFISTLGHLRRLRWARSCKTAIEEYGYNDFNSSGRTVAQLQADCIATWALLSSLGMRVFRTTLIPSTTSTDGWRTTANQTVKAIESNRVAFNNWLRDGAPMVAGAAAATGIAAGATVARANYFQGNTLITPATRGVSAAAHPLYGVAEIADTVESARDSGKFKAPVTSRTITDGQITSTQTVVTSPAQGAFTTADLGKLVTFPGAGAAGGLLLGTVRSIFSGTTLGITTAAGTTVASGGTVNIYDGATGDGTHMWPFAATLAAAGLPTNYFA